MKKRTRECSLPAPRVAAITAGRRCRPEKHQATNIIRRVPGRRVRRRRRASFAPTPANNNAGARWLQLPRCSSCSSFQQRGSASKPTAAPSKGSSGRLYRRGVSACRLVKICCSNMFNAREQCALACDAPSHEGEMAQRRQQRRSAARTAEEVQGSRIILRP